MCCIDQLNPPPRPDIESELWLAPRRQQCARDRQFEARLSATATAAQRSHTVPAGERPAPAAAAIHLRKATDRTQS